MVLAYCDFCEQDCISTLRAIPLGEPTWDSPLILFFYFEHVIQFNPTLHLFYIWITISQLEAYFLLFFFPGNER